MSCDHRRNIELQYDHATRIQRSIETCDECDHYACDVSMRGDECYPKTVDDFLDLGLDPYLLEVFGAPAELCRASTPNRSRSVAPSSSPSPRYERPSIDDEAWRRAMMTVKDL